MTDQNEETLRVLSTLLSRAKLASRVGQTYNGKRDLYEALGYKRNIEFEDYAERYLRGGIASRLVDAKPESTWRNQPEVVAVKGPDNSKFNRAWIELAKARKVFHYLERVDRVAGIGRYATLLIGVKGGRGLGSEIQKVKGVDGILFLTPYSEGNSKIHEFVSTPSDKRFGLPSSYQVSINRDANSPASTDGTIAQQIEVHHSRLIHVAEGLVEDDIFGQPRMQKVWNYLDDLDKIVGGSAEAVWRTMDRGIQFDIDPDKELSAPDEAAMTAQIDEFVHEVRRTLQTRGVEAKVLETSTPDPVPTFTVVASLIAGTVGIPQRVLFGSERGQLASEVDEKNFHARIKERQTSYAEPLILRPFIDKCISIGALPVPSGGYKVTWPDLSTLTMKEKADVAARNAQAARAMSEMFGEGKTPIITVPEAREHFLSLPPDPDKEEIT